MSAMAESISIEDVTNKFLGAWELVAYESKHPDGKVVQPFTENPKGYVIYDKSGYFSLTMMHPGEFKFAEEDFLKATKDETHLSFYTRAAYSGCYEFDLEKSAIIHKLHTCTSPNIIGTDQYRFFTITDTELTLVTPELPFGGDQVIQTVRWKRL